MKPLVIYHDNCNDGFCAAWIARKRMPEAEFLPAQYGQDPPDVGGREVFILDFSYRRQQTIILSQTAKKLVVLDHHITAQEALAGLSAGMDDGLIRFDMSKSGARLAWEYFFRGKYCPWLVDYVEDRDLWTWKLQHSHEVNAALSSYPRDFDRWEQLLVRDSPTSLAIEGTAILRYQQQVVDSQVKNAAEMEMDGHKILAVNATVLISEIAGKLAEGKPFGATYLYTGDRKKVWSLRSRDGGVDVSEIAKKHGGGGHRNAASFSSEVANG